MAQSTIAQTRQTLTDYMSIGYRRAEIINRELVVMSPNQRGPVLIGRRLFLSLYQFAQEGNLGEVLPDGATFILDAEQRTDWINEAYMPDVSFISRDRYDAHNTEYGDSDGPWWLAPDLAVGIISPTDRYTDVTHKVAVYLEHGVQAVWVIDPRRQTIKVHTGENPDGITRNESERLEGAPVLPGWSMAIREIFEGLSAQTDQR